MIASKTKSLSQVVKAIVPQLEIDADMVRTKYEHVEFCGGSLPELASSLSSVQLSKLQAKGVTLIGIWTAGGMARVHFARPRTGVQGSISGKTSGGGGRA